jgi:hypothetical protein
MNRALASISALLLLVPSFAFTQVLPPSRGGTGTGTAPAYGQLLVGNASGGYTLTATSSLGISGGSGSGFSTTSADYWKSVRDFFSTTSAQYFVSVTNLFSTTSADYWGSTKGYATFSYLFPGNATSSALTFSNGIVADVTGNLTGNAGTASALAANGANCSSGQAPLGVSASGASENCFDVWTEAENTAAAYAPQSRALTIAGTANQITSSAGAQSLASDRTWTLSLPSYVVFPGSFRTTNSTTTNATTTALDITGLLTFDGITGTSWEDFCTAITGSADLCDGEDATADAGSAFSTTSTDYWKTQRDFFSTTSASYFSGLGLAFSTTSADYWETQQTGRTADDLTNNSIEDLLDVGSFTQALGDLLFWNGSAWANIATSSLNISWDDLVGIPAGFADGTDDNTEYTAGDGLTLTGTDIDFDGGDSPQGDLGGTWANPSVDNDSHNHTTLTISGLDISSDTNLTAGDALTLNGDDIDFDGGASPGGSLGGTWASPTIDDLFLLNTGDTGTGLYSFANSSTSLASFGYASSTLYFGAGLTACESGNFLTWASGRFGCEADDTGAGGNAFDYLFPSDATSTQISFSGGLTSFGSKIASTTAIVCKQSAACDYTSIQSAIDAGWTNIYVRNGVYSEQVDLSNAKTQIVGESLNAIIQCNGSTQSPCITADEDEFKIANLTIRETNATLNGVGIDFSDSALGLIDGVRINNFATSTRAVDTSSNTFYNKIQNSTFFNPRTCIEMGGSQPNANWSSWNRCRPMAVNGAFGIYLSDTRGFTSIADDFEGTTTAVTSTGIFVDGTSREISFTNPWVEANGTGVNIASGANRVTFQGGSITSNGTDITDNGTNTVWINTSDTGVLVNRFGNATSTSFAITSLGTAAGSFLAVNPDGSVIATSTPSGSGITTIKEGDSTAVLNAVAIDFGLGFDVLAEGGTEGNVTLDLREYNGAASTSLLSANYASSTLYFGAGLTDCHTGNMLTWTNGIFGCEADDAGEGGGLTAYDAWTHPSAGVSATTSSMIFTNASSTFTGGLNSLYATTSALYVTELTASRPIFTDANKRLSNTGTVGAIEAAVGSQNILLETEIDGCSELAGLLDGETGGCNGASGPVFPDGPTLTGTTTMTNASISGAISLLGEYFTNFTTYVRSLFSGGTGITLSSGAISFDCSEVEGTGINCSGENITLDATGDWTGTFDGVEGSAFALAAGDTYSGTHDFSAATVKQHTYASFSYSTSTAWTGTTTIPLGPAYTAESWSGAKCFTDTGTVNVSFYDGSNRMNLFNASTTVGSVTLSTNNTFTASEKRYVDIGTPASTPTKISCTVDKIVNN